MRRLLTARSNPSIDLRLKYQGASRRPLHGAKSSSIQALEALTGSRQMDATAIRDYFAPLQAWLDQQNAGKPTGW